MVKETLPLDHREGLTRVPAPPSRSTWNPYGWLGVTLEVGSHLQKKIRHGSGMGSSFTSSPRALDDLVVSLMPKFSQCHVITSRYPSEPLQQPWIFWNRKQDTLIRWPVFQIWVCVTSWFHFIRNDFQMPLLVHSPLKYAFVPSPDFYLKPLGKGILVAHLQISSIQWQNGRASK